MVAEFPPQSGHRSMQENVEIGDADAECSGALRAALSLEYAHTNRISMAGAEAVQ